MILGITDTGLEKLFSAAIPALYWIFLLWERRR
jgi:hypothetical protein